mmetsp:Transcript_13572/g.33994  ORF Transcript_13572/g.33994 Transcript_13572/m.33994 type:complete len:295 (+) Transcript_13572:683-1567(+)
MPCRAWSGDVAASFKKPFTSSMVVPRLTSNTLSVSDAFVSGTRTATPFSLPFSSGKISAMAVADPVEVGARLTMPLRARRRSDFFAFVASSIICVLVTSWIVVMLPLTMPSFSWITFTTGARQLVVQLAAVTMWSFDASYSPWFTPYTMLSTGDSASFTGADTTTFFTPQAKYGASEARVRCTPVHSMIIATPLSAQGTSAGFSWHEHFTWHTRPSFIETTKLDDPASNSTFTSAHVPCTLSNCARYAQLSPTPGNSLTCTTSNTSGCSNMRRNASLPIRPKPLSPTLMGAMTS